MKSKISEAIDQLAAEPDAPKFVKDVQKALHNSHFCPDGRPHYWGFWDWFWTSTTCKRCGHYEWTRND